jgi:hypothetical protein
MEKMKKQALALAAVLFFFVPVFLIFTGCQKKFYPLGPLTLPSPTASPILSITPIASLTFTPTPTPTATSTSTQAFLYTPTPTPTGCAKVHFTLSAPGSSPGTPVTLSGYFGSLYCWGTHYEVDSMTFDFNSTGNLATQLQQAQLFSGTTLLGTVTYTGSGPSSASFSGSPLMTTNSTTYYSLVLTFGASAAGVLDVNLPVNQITGTGPAGFFVVSPNADTGSFSVGGSATVTPTVIP